LFNGVANANAVIAENGEIEAAAEIEETEETEEVVGIKPGKRLVKDLSLAKMARHFDA
jgi:hypothetical protein